jgi:hypothetical protein
MRHEEETVSHIKHIQEGMAGPMKTRAGRCRLPHSSSWQQMQDKVHSEMGPQLEENMHAAYACMGTRNYCQVLVLTVDVVYVFAVSAEGNPGQEIPRHGGGEPASVILEQLAATCDNSNTWSTTCSVCCCDPSAAKG